MSTIDLVAEPKLEAQTESAPKTIHYARGLYIDEQIADGETLKVNFRSTVAIVTRSGDRYAIQTDAALDVGNPGARACSGIFADCAMKRALHMLDSTPDETRARLSSLSAREANACLKAIGGMAVNKADFHRKRLGAAKGNGSGADDELEGCKYRHPWPRRAGWAIDRALEPLVQFHIRRDRARAAERDNAGEPTRG